MARPNPPAMHTRVRRARSHPWLGQPAGDQRRLLDQRAAQRCRRRQNRLCRSANGVDDRHRRHAATGVARCGQLPVPDHRQLPAALAVRARRHHLGDRRQRAQPLTTPQHVDGGGGVVPQPGRGLVAVGGGQVARCAPARAPNGPLSRPSTSSAARRGAAAYSVGGDVAGRRARRQFAFRTGRAVQRGAGQPGSAGAHAGEPGQQRGGFDRVGAGRGTARRRGRCLRRCGTDREARETLRRSAPPTTTGAETSTGGCRAGHVRPAAAARAPRPPGRARTRRGRRRWPATPSPSSGCAGRRR